MDRLFVWLLPSLRGWGVGYTCGWDLVLGAVALSVVECFLVLLAGVWWLDFLVLACYIGWYYVYALVWLCVCCVDSCFGCGCDLSFCCVC